VTTIDRLLIRPDLHVAKLSPVAAAHLRFALARHWAFRDLSRADELSRAIGRRVLDVAAVRAPKDRIRVQLVLEDGEELTLEGSSKPAPPTYAAQRQLGSTPD
jgi:hypothetical protein